MYGVVEVLPEVREYKYEEVCGVAKTSYPSVFEIPHENTGTLKNQEVNDCVGCVMAQIVEEFIKRKTGDQKEFSETYAYGYLREDKDSYKGMIVPQALGQLVSKGIVPKSYFDIEEEMPKMRTTVKKFPELSEIAKKYVIRAYVTLSYNSNMDNLIKDALTKYNYGLVGVSHRYFGGSHCIQITGWNDTKNTYKFKNSWGKSYGKDGFSEIPKSKLDEAYLLLYNEIYLPFEDVKEDDWFYDDVKKMYFSGLIKGTTDYTFEPEKPMTRAEVSTVVNRLAKQFDERITLLNRLINEKLSKN